MVSFLSMRQTFRNLVGATALLALLLFATSAGEALHHHESTSPDAHCSICHLSHQSLEPAAHGQRVISAELVGSLPTPQDPLFVASPRSPLLATRAPPSA
jgi:hypothetical protein